MEVRFKNFRCFKDTGLLKLKNITLLIGENSSGKTSFLAGLNHISGLMNDENVDLNSPPFELGSFKDIFNASSKQEDRCFEYECKVADNCFQWVFEDDQGEPKVSLFTIRSDTKDFTMEFNVGKSELTIEMPLTEKEQELLKFVGGKFVNKQNSNTNSKRMVFQKLDEIPHNKIMGSAFNFREVIWRFERKFLDIPFRRIRRGEKKEQERLAFDDLAENNREVLHNLYQKMQRFTLASRPFRRFERENKYIALAPLRTEPSRVYSFAQSRARLTPDGSHVPDKLLRHSSSTGGRYKEMEYTLQEFGKEAGLFQSIYTKNLVRNSNYLFSIMVKTAQGRKSNIMDVGYGVSQILPVIFEIISSGKQQRFLLQQPEVHLQPRAQAAFATLIAKLTHDKKSFVIETHSDFILERLKYEIEEGNLSHSDVGILFFDTEKQDTKIHQINLGEDGLPTDTPPSYRKFFLQELDKVWS